MFANRGSDAVSAPHRFPLSLLAGLLPPARCVPLALAAVFALWAPQAPAQDTQITTLGVNGAWEAFTYQEDGSTVCFITSTPERDEGNYTNRGDIFFQVTHRPANQTRNVISVITGYTYQPDSRPEITISDQQWRLFTEANTAWAFTEDDETELVDAMRRGRTMVVTGTSNRGTLTTDTYSLIGFTASMRLINDACDLG